MRLSYHSSMLLFIKHTLTHTHTFSVETKTCFNDLITLHGQHYKEMVTSIEAVKLNKESVSIADWSSK